MTGTTDFCTLSAHEPGLVWPRFTRVSGTILNVVGLLVGGLVGLLTRAQLSPSSQTGIKVLLGVFTVWTGLRMTWESISGTFWSGLGQFGLAMLALSLGHATGNLLRIQHRLNHLGRFAKDNLDPQIAGKSNPPPQVFLACVIVFAANPLGVYGALLDGFAGHWELLAIKAVMDGLSALAFARFFGWRVLLSIIPVLAFQGTLALGAQLASQRLFSEEVVHSITAAGGLLVFSASLVVLNLKTVKLADYLPTFVYAPLLAWWLR